MVLLADVYVYIFIPQVRIYIAHIVSEGCPGS